MMSGDFAHVAVKALLLGRRLFSYRYKPGLSVRLDRLSPQFTFTRYLRKKLSQFTMI